MDSDEEMVIYEFLEDQANAAARDEDEYLIILASSTITSKRAEQCQILSIRHARIKSFTKKKFYSNYYFNRDMMRFCRIQPMDKN
jgi:hypothetical protein